MGAELIGKTWGWLVVGAYLLLPGCATPQPSPPPGSATEISSASKGASQRWAFCVFRKVEDFASGSDDAQVIAETAAEMCEREHRAWLGSLGRDNLDRAFMDGYTEGLTKSVKNEAAGLVLKRRAAGKGSGHFQR